MKLYTILFILLFISCKQPNPKIERSEKKEVAKVTSETQEKLQGTWVNLADTLSTITFKGNTSKNSYSGLENDTEIFFTVDANCKTTGSVSTSEPDSYINTTGTAEECYYIKTLNETTLELQLMAQNVTLQFKKQR
ncbi:hypothetical protein G5B37_12490 [Rasiella rasia]|uniref:Lipocalin-like domain-containing protein n=1 Tax=Rasiella rasia TaxID=2744027 RepID=A0A6G6GPF4_9FLAO|nr:hypothetical protein [Rasiella rasia]QIE60350.1 hypothetical protein G5B37_12490 [Rasiella rasia]